MEKFKRKIALLDIPVIQIDNLCEFTDAVQSFWKDAKQLKSKALKAALESFERKHLDIFVNDEMVIFKALIGVEESAIMFVDQTAEKEFVNHSDKHTILLIKERSIVENIEVALYRINNGSGFYGKYMGIIQPSDIPEKCVLVICKK